MKRTILAILFALLFATGAVYGDERVSGSIIAADTTCSAGVCVTLRLPFGASAAAIRVTGTLGGGTTLQFEASIDGESYVSVTGFPISSGSGATSTTSTGTWQVQVAGFQFLRVRCSTLGTGSAIVLINGSTGVFNPSTADAAEGATPTNPPVPIAGLDGSGNISIPRTNATHDLKFQLVDSSGNNIAFPLLVYFQSPNSSVTTITADGYGATPYSFISTASANLTSVTSDATTLYSITLINPTATLQWVRLYNKESAPDPSACSANSDCPVIYAPIPANGTTGAGFTIPLGPKGLQFSLGLGYSISGAACTVVSTCTDETNAAAGVTIILAYK